MHIWKSFSVYSNHQPMGKFVPMPGWMDQIKAKSLFVSPFEVWGNRANKICYLAWITHAWPCAWIGYMQYRSINTCTFRLSRWKVHTLIFTTTLWSWSWISQSGLDQAFWLPLSVATAVLCSTSFCNIQHKLQFSIKTWLQSNLSLAGCVRIRDISLLSFTCKVS